MKLKLIFLSLFAFAFLTVTSAQVVYGLRDCIGLGLERNFSIRVAKNNETISKNNVTLGNAGYLPSLSLSSRYSGTITSTTQDIDATGKGTVINKDAGATSGSLGATLSMTIFNGFSVQTTYKKLGELSKLGELNTQMTIENYLATLVSVYYSYIQQVQIVNNKLYAVTLSKERLRIDEERYLLGSNSRLQVQQSRVYFNADSSSLSKQIETLRATRIRLNELMAVENMGMMFELKDTSIKVIPDLYYEKLYDETMKSNTSLLIAEKNKTISGYDYKLVVARSYPYLTFSGGYNYTLNTTTLSSTYKNQLLNGPNYGLTFGVNIFNGFNTRKDIRNSQISVQSSELRYEEVLQGVKADLLTIYNAYSNNLKLITLQEQNYETASDNLSIAFEKYKLGNLSGLDLRDVQKSLLDAKESLLSIQYQAKLAEISLLEIAGRIMEYY